MAQPMTLTLYDKENEPIKTYTQPFVPWMMLKEAVRIAKKLDPENMTEESIDELSALVVAVFRGQFSIEDLKGADLGEMITVIRMIVNRANGLDGNPTHPG